MQASPHAWVAGNDPNLDPKGPIGSGGFGDVYEVFRLQTGLTVGTKYRER